ncbi:MAG: hypothetical protein NTX50_20010 [Candidatus Sumerlaeota bacterium]|nr:hypothetical protein [Candidatus Sumerlaeota bacterium]
MDDAQVTVELRVFDVGQGLCQILSFRGEHGTPPAFVVIDGGPVRGKNDCLPLQFLAENSEPEIAALVVSHNDSDHYNGALDIINAFSNRIRAIYFPYDREPSALKIYDVICKEGACERFTGEIYQAYVPKLGRAYPIYKRGVSVLYMLAPNFPNILGAYTESGVASPTNRCSAILALDCGGQIFLMPADADRPALLALNKYEAFRPDVMVAPHHGGILSSADTVYSDYVWLLKDVLHNPKHVIFSVGTQNRHSHPCQEAFDACQDCSAEILCTQMTARCHNHIRSVAEEKGFDMPSYSRSSLCRGSCAGCHGTVRIRIGTGTYEIENLGRRRQDIMNRKQGDSNFHPQCL